jgi:hypothetical protein
MAMARPMPRPDPVTTAILPSSVPMGGALLSLVNVRPLVDGTERWLVVPHS